ncbi:MAG: hypothetical protein EOL95_00160 [Bacteroidia bacterium]|nr:hypothetical protein [Bacteroidia bacterium]
MHRLTYILILLFCGLCVAQAGQGIKVWGNDPEYAGDSLSLYIERDGLTHHQIEIGKCLVAQDGSFSINAKIDSTQKCYINLGAVIVSIFIEPGSSYSVNLPDKKPLTTANKLNPYFKAKEILLSINNPKTDDINLQIAAFEDDMDKEWAALVFGEINKQNIENACIRMENKYNSDNEFFRIYRFSNYALIVNLYEPTSPDLAIETYFLHNPVHYNNPAYWEAFDVLFEQFIEPERLSDNKLLYELVVMQKVLNKELIVKQLEKVTSKQNTIIADEIRTQLNSLRIGNLLNIQKLVNINGDTLQWKDFDCPLVYVVFANSSIKESKADMAFAKKIQSKWKNKCAMIFIFDKEPRETTLKTAQKNELSFFTFSTEDNPEIITTFAISNIPNYILIDYEGRIIQNPAKKPTQFTP